jgi:glycosyltransferase involved in cell wall biosynthesis
MRIAQLATNVESVPPLGYGGTEIVVNLLTEALVSGGHEVTLFASGDSKTKARLVSVTECGLRTNPKILQRQWQSFDLQTLIKLKHMKGEFDLIHNHMGYQALPFLDELGVPSLTTLHNPVKPYNYPIYQEFKHLPFVAISDAFRRLNHGDLLNYVATVYNGINLDLYPYPENAKRDYLLFLGRICHDKGTADAVEIAERLGLPLKIAGKVDEPDRPYFEEKVKPKLSHTIEYLGEVNHEQKLKLYANAIALLHPINFDEPFGLTLVEALAEGTPVVAIARGSIPEVLSDKETAVLGKTKEELIERFGEIEKIEPKACRKRVQEKFSKERMVDDYVKLYDRLVNQAAPGKDKPKHYVEA